MGAALEASVYVETATDVWTDITADVMAAEGIRIHYGISGDKPMDAMGLLAVTFCRILQSHAVVPQPPVRSDTPYKLPVHRMDHTLTIDEVLGVPRDFLKLT